MHFHSTSFDYSVVADIAKTNNYIVLLSDILIKFHHAIAFRGQFHKANKVVIAQVIGEDGVNWPVGLSGRPHLCGN